jgi:hypothetical protein
MHRICLRPGQSATSNDGLSGEANVEKFCLAAWISIARMFIVCVPLSWDDALGNRSSIWSSQAGTKFPELLLNSANP